MEEANVNQIIELNNNNIPNNNINNISDINFSIIDSPGDTENDEMLAIFSEKGYTYSKMFIYIINEMKPLDADDMKNNKNLKILMYMKLNYKIPLIILLTHSDDYCDNIKKTEHNWKEICKKGIEGNKTKLIEFMNKNNLTMEENNIIHTVLFEPEKQKEKTDEEIINELDEEDKKLYDSLDDNGKKSIIKMYRQLIEKNNPFKDVTDFIKENGVLGQKQLIEKMKEYIPSQYHEVLMQIN